MRKGFILILLLAILCVDLSAQSIASAYTLRGKVVEASGQPIIGANVKIDNTSTGTITNLDGVFSLLVSSKGTKLLISYIGFKSEEVLVNDKANNLTIVLKEDAQNLDEVVVVGYGTQKKSSLTSSIETISGENILRMPTMNLDEALVGQVAGMHVKTSTGDPSSAKEADIRIRGINGSPLLVIDGVPRFGNNTSDGEMRMSDLNPDDIESISILKDAAAAAVYGARAANGVILVKTKRGGSDQKVRINYRGQFNLQQATKLPNFLDGYAFAQLFNKAVENTPGNTNKPYNEEQLNQIKGHLNPNVYADENLLNHLNPYGYATIHSLSLSGGSNFLKYYISGGYTNSQGLYGGVSRDRYNYSVKLDANLLPSLSFAIDVIGSLSDNKNTSNSTIDAAYNFSPLQPLRFTNGMLASNGGSNPLIAMEGLGGYVRNGMNMNTISGTLTYRPSQVKGLSAYLRATIDKNNQSVINYNKPVALYTYKTTIENGIEIPQYIEDPNTVYPKAKISRQEREQFINNKLLEASISYSRTFVEKHDVSALVVVNYQDYKNRYLMGKNNNLPGPYPEILGSTSTGTVNGSEYFNERASIVGRLNYGYDNRYFIEGSFRIDGSTKFHPDSRWGFFPTASASWVASNEPFFKAWDQNILSNLKFRGSIGRLGRDGGIEDYSYLYNYIFSPIQGYPIGDTTMSPGIIPSTGNYPNPALSWEKSTDYNLATDIAFWDNRLGITVEYFQRYRTQMITSAPAYLYPPSTGVGGSVPNMNFGKIKAWGWDMTINHKNNIGKVKYDINLTLSRSADMVLDYGDESSVDEALRRKGKSSMVWFVYDADGLFKDQKEIDELPFDQDGNNNETLRPGDIKYKDSNGDKVLSTADRIAVRNSSYPALSFGLNMGIRYYGFSINAMFQGAGDYQQKVGDIYSLNDGTLPRFQDFHLTDSWRPDNLDARYPQVKFMSSQDNNRKDSDFWIRNSSFVRLKSLSIGYALPTSLLKKMQIKSLNISLQGSNLFTWSTLKGYDPESLRGYPVQRSYGVTLNFGF